MPFASGTHDPLYTYKINHWETFPMCQLDNQNQFTPIRATDQLLFVGNVIQAHHNYVQVCCVTTCGVLAWPVCLPLVGSCVVTRSTSVASPPLTQYNEPIMA